MLVMPYAITVLKHLDATSYNSLQYIKSIKPAIEIFSKRNVQITIVYQREVNIFFM